MSAYFPQRKLGYLDGSLRAPLAMRTTKARLATAAAVVLFGSAAIRLAFPPEETLALLPDPPSAARPLIQLNGVSVERRHGYATVTGSLTNLSRQALTNVEALVLFYDSDGRLVKLESALVETEVTPPGGDSAFRVHSPDQEQIRSFRVQFRTLLGGALPSRTAPD